MSVDSCHVLSAMSDASRNSELQDDGSLSKPKQYHKHHRTIPKRKGLSVRFPEAYEEMALVVCEIEPCMNMTDDDRKRLWYARSDYHFSRSTARVIAKESERYGHSKQLDGVYIATFDQHVQDALNLWARHGHSRRGLERWANSHHGNVRKDDQYMYQQGVLRAQQELKLKEGTSSCSSVPRAERLREVGHILSRKSRLFAQMLGEADAYAAQWEYGMMMHVQPSHHYPGMTSSPAAMAAAAAAAGVTQLPHGMVTPTLVPRRRNLGLSGSIAANAHKVNRVSDLPAPRSGSSRVLSNHHEPPPPRRTNSTSPAVGGAAAPSGHAVGTSPQFVVKTRSAGRVPRMA